MFIGISSLKVEPYIFWKEQLQRKDILYLGEPAGKIVCIESKQKAARSRCEGIAVHQYQILFSGVALSLTSGLVPLTYEYWCIQHMAACFVTNIYTDGNDYPWIEHCTTSEGDTQNIRQIRGLYLPLLNALDAVQMDSIHTDCIVLVGGPIFNVRLGAIVEKRDVKMRSSSYTRHCPFLSRCKKPSAQVDNIDLTLNSHFSKTSMDTVYAIPHQEVYIFPDLVSLNYFL
ncbi:hypothetical protein BDB01DRAFT_897835 [Pilobolus umbonatus]|nr:hypothetical protein BDB01DRAFT_897835 [Pilobolus umbonatus]